MKLRDIVFGLAGFLGLAGFAGCGGDSARLGGHFIGAAHQPVYLERVMPGAATPQIDTVVTNDRGEFTFKVALPDRQPTIFNLKYNGEMVPLLISPREKVNVLSLGDLDGYRVSGSPESELVWRLHRILSGGAAALDSISTNYNRSIDNRERFRREWIDKYLSIKRQQIAFIVDNSSSLAAVYALYQRLPGDDVLSNAETDIVYYRMVADSVRRRYPDSRYLAALDRELAGRENQQALIDRINTEGVNEVAFPDIDLPDMYGERVKMSSMAGKVIVLDFWNSTLEGASINNAEMKEMFSELAGRGLAIYQVSLDTDRAVWVNAVQQQRLPWTTVCDFRGETTQPVMMYNVESIPANFVFDREGNIAARNLRGDALRKKIEELL